MSTLVVVTAYDSSGAPLPDLSPVWNANMCKVAATGADVSGPSISAIGGGQYKADLPAALCGFIDFGETASPRYLFVPPDDGTVVIPAFNASTGAPLAGLTLGWTSYRNQSTGSSISPEATFTPLGGGMYRIDGLTDAEAVGVIDATEAANPRRYSMVTPPGHGPSVSQSPASGTEIDPADAITVTVTGDAADLAIVVLSASWGGDSENVYNPLTGFAPKYAGASTKAETTSKLWVFVLRRRGGWPEGRTVSIGQAVSDRAGNTVP